MATVMDKCLCHSFLRTACGARRGRSRRAPPASGWTPTGTGTLALGVRPRAIWGAGTGQPGMTSSPPLSCCPLPLSCPSGEGGGGGGGNVRASSETFGEEGGTLRLACSLSVRRFLPVELRFEPTEGFPSISSAPAFCHHFTQESVLLGEPLLPPWARPPPLLKPSWGGRWGPQSYKQLLAFP